jgi:hypothetical protein
VSPQRAPAEVGGESGVPGTCEGKPYARATMMAATERQETPSGEDNIVHWGRPKLSVIITDKTEETKTKSI